MDKPDPLPVFDPAFRDMFEQKGLRAALQHLLDQHDLADDEFEFIRVTMHGIRATATAAAS